MDRDRSRYRLIPVFLQASEPLTERELANRSGLSPSTLRAGLDQLCAERLVIAGDLVPGKASPQYIWAARWESVTGRKAAGSREKLSNIVDSLPKTLSIDSEAVLAFNRFVLGEYQPPVDKRGLVFFQCSVRRPFYRSPSHGTMCKAITLATGFHPAKDFERCPVHVVVLASHIGPVPYELQDIHPANVAGGGVKGFDDEQYARVKPILARRMADYLETHGTRYEHIASFTDGRYGDVMRETQRLARVTFPIFPDAEGPRVTWTGRSRPRKYWDKCWIQLYLEILRWLPLKSRNAAEGRLAKLGVEYE
jgi:lambda repressor-like predicted transcriptional regulator